MSTNRPAFANSLVAMYGSSPETSDDDEDSNDDPQQPTKSPVSDAENVEVDPQVILSSSGDARGSPSLDKVSTCVNDSFGDVPHLKSAELESSTRDVTQGSLCAVNEEMEPSSQGTCDPTQAISDSKSSSPSDIVLCTEPEAPRVLDDVCKEESTIESPVIAEEGISHFKTNTSSKSPLPHSVTPDPVGISLSEASQKSPENEEPMEEVGTVPILDEALRVGDKRACLEEMPSNTDQGSSCESTIDNNEVESSIDDLKQKSSENSDLSKKSLFSENVMLGEESHASTNDISTSLKTESALSGLQAGRRLRQVRNPSVKAAEAAADAAYVAAVTPTRKNLKEAKTACALAKVSDPSDVTHITKKNSNSTPLTRTRKGRSSSNERSTDSRNSPLSFSASGDGNPHEELITEESSACEGKLTPISEELTSSSDPTSEGESESALNKSASVVELEKPAGIKLKISRESVQILDPKMSKLEVLIPSETAQPEFSSSPGGTKRLRKLKEGTLSPAPPLSPITLRIAKSKEGLEVVSTESPSFTAPDTECGKVEKITLKLSREEGPTIVKPTVEDSVEHKPEKITLKLIKDEISNTFSSTHVQDDDEKNKLEKITLKLSKSDGACIVKRREHDPVSSSSDQECGKLERITLKLSTDNNVSIVRPKDAASHFERSASASPEPGKIEKITLKVSKNDNVSIVKPLSPTPSSGIEKLTLKMSKDGTAAVSGKQHDEPSRDGENSKLEKITLKLSKEEGVSIVKPASPVLDRKTLKLGKEEPLPPLSPLIISRTEEVEPPKERITLKLAKAGGHPSPVGVIDERSSWSIKSTDSDNIPSPVTSEPATPKSRPKRNLSDISDVGPSSSKRLKMSDMEKHDDSETLLSLEKRREQRNEFEYLEEEKMDVAEPPVIELEAAGGGPKSDEEITTDPLNECSKEDSMDVIVLDSEDSQADPSALPSISIIDIESETPTMLGGKGRRKPRGRPRKSVLTPGAMPQISPSLPPAEDSVSTPKAKREKVRPEPVESDRPKRSCKGRGSAPPKPVKPIKPRGRAALAKQKTDQGIQPEEPQLFEEETRMSADQSDTPASQTMSVVGNSSSGLLPKVMVSRLQLADTPVDSLGPSITNDESQASQGSVSLISSTTESTPNRGNRKGRMEINVDPDAQAEFTVDMIAEYKWPIADGAGETYMIQEQISAYLGVKSFKRKYPNMERRTVDHDERQYLLENKLVSEALCDLGLTALPSHEVLDVLCNDFPEKFEEYRRFSREKIQREFSMKQKAMLAAVSSGKDDTKSKYDKLAVKNMLKYNSMLNNQRRDVRCCFDLQNFTIHYPEHRRRRMAVPNPPRVGPYPLALVPGQYTDFYKEYTAAELRYFPVNTVLYGPLLPHELVKSNTGGSDGSQSDSSDSSSSDSSSSDSDSSGSDSDSDSDSSSESGDEESCQVVQGTVESQEDTSRPDAVCRVCNGDRLKNKLGHPESLIHCASCEKSGHLSCLELTVDMMPHIRKYAWHCTDCKLCAQCNDTADEDKMLFCDMCDRGYHIYCVGLRKVPEGRWHCQECAVCASCGARDPGGTEEHQAAQNLISQEPSKAESLWQHEFKKGDKGLRVYVRTLCVPCSKLWRKGRYCRLCWKCFTNQPEEEGLINCSICDRWMHADCCRKAGRVIDVEKLSSYICELCQQKGVILTGGKSPIKITR